MSETTIIQGQEYALVQSAAVNPLTDIGSMKPGWVWRMRAWAGAWPSMTPKVRRLVLVDAIGSTPQPAPRACVDCAVSVRHPWFPSQHDQPHCIACYDKHRLCACGHLPEQHGYNYNNVGRCLYGSCSCAEYTTRDASLPEPVPPKPTDALRTRNRVLTDDCESALKPVAASRYDKTYCENAPPREVVEGAGVVLDGDECGGVPKTPFLKAHKCWTARMSVEWQRHDEWQKRWSAEAGEAAKRVDSVACLWAHLHLAAVTDHDRDRPTEPDMYSGTVVTDDAGRGFRCRLCGGWIRALP